MKTSWFGKPTIQFDDLPSYERTFGSGISQLAMSDDDVAGRNDNSQLLGSTPYLGRHMQVASA